MDGQFNTAAQEILLFYTGDVKLHKACGSRSQVELQPVWAGYTLDQSLVCPGPLTVQRQTSIHSLIHTYVQLEELINSHSYKALTPFVSATSDRLTSRQER